MPRADDRGGPFAHEVLNLRERHITGVLAVDGVKVLGHHRHAGLSLFARELAVVRRVRLREAGLQLREGPCHALVGGRRCGHRRRARWCAIRCSGQALRRSRS
jgi:hypothetical protein